MNKLVIILSCTWKFALTFPVAVYAMRMNFRETLLYTNLGGILGVLFFTYLARFLIQAWQKFIAPRFSFRKQTKPVFTRKNRRLIGLKNRYGFAGIVILNPVIISIPISTFLVAKFYKHQKYSILWLIAGQFAWSLIYTFFYIYIKDCELFSSLVAMVYRTEIINFV